MRSVRSDSFGSDAAGRRGGVSASERGSARRGQDRKEDGPSALPRSVEPTGGTSESCLSSDAAGEGGRPIRAFLPAVRLPVGLDSTRMWSVLVSLRSSSSLSTLALRRLRLDADAGTGGGVGGA